MSTPDLLNIFGLILNSGAAVLLVVSAPMPQRMTYFHGVEDMAPMQRKDRRTKRAHWVALRLLVFGVFLQLAAQCIR